MLCLENRVIRNVLWARWKTGIIYRLQKLLSGSLSTWTSPRFVRLRQIYNHPQIGCHTLSFFSELALIRIFLYRCINKVKLSDKIGSTFKMFSISCLKFLVITSSLCQVNGACRACFPNKLFWNDDNILKEGWRVVYCTEFECSLTENFLTDLVKTREPISGH